MTTLSERLRPSTQRKRELIHRRPSSSSQLQQQLLIAFIKKSDDLSKNWMPSKKKKRSEGDIHALEQQWERLHGINQQFQAERRSSWNSLIFSKSFLPRSLRWDTLTLSSNVSARLDAIAHKPSEGRRRESSWHHIASKWRATFALCRRQSKDLKIKLKTHYHALSASRLFEDRGSILSALKTMSINLFAMTWDIVRDMWSILRIMLRFSWFLLKWSTLFVLIGLLCLQILAFIYTLFSTAFLNSFCQRSLPFVRNFVCSSWDELRNNLDMRSTTNLNHSFRLFFKATKRLCRTSYHFILQDIRQRYACFEPLFSSQNTRLSTKRTFAIISSTLSTKAVVQL